MTQVVRATDRIRTGENVTIPPKVAKEVIERSKDKLTKTFITNQPQYTSMTHNTYPHGYRHAIEQHEHEKWNATHYPGTLQLCSICDEPTGRCEDDAIWTEDGEPLCEECYELAQEDTIDTGDI